MKKIKLFLSGKADLVIGFKIKDYLDLTLFKAIWFCNMLQKALKLHDKRLVWL